MVLNWVWILCTLQISEDVGEGVLGGFMGSLSGTEVCDNEAQFPFIVHGGGGPRKPETALVDRTLWIFGHSFAPWWIFCFVVLLFQEREIFSVSPSRGSLLVIGFSELLRQSRRGIVVPLRTRTGGSPKLCVHLNSLSL